MDKPSVHPQDLEHVTEVNVSAGVKRQLEQYEPINEQVTVTVDLTGADDAAEKLDRIEAGREAAWAEAERGVLTRYEEHLDEETFGE